MTKLFVVLISALGLTACGVAASQYRAQELATKKCYDALENENATKKQLEVALQDLQTAMDELTAERARLSSETGELKDSVSALETAVNEKLKEVRQLSRRNSQLESQQATLAAKNRTFEDLVSSLEKEMKDKLIEVHDQQRWRGSAVYRARCRRRPGRRFSVPAARVPRRHRFRPVECVRGCVWLSRSSWHLSPPGAEVASSWLRRNTTGEWQ